MNCKDIKILMIEDIYNEITTKNKKILNDHLQACPACENEYNELKKTAGVLQLWEDEKTETTDFPPNVLKPKKSGTIIYRFVLAAAALFLILSFTNFRLFISENTFDVRFSLLGYSTDSQETMENILTSGSRIEQLQLMTDLINTANSRQKEEMVTLLTDFYQAIEMRRQADLRVIAQGMEAIRSTANQRMDDTDQTLQGLIQYTGSVLDKGVYLKNK